MSSQQGACLVCGKPLKYFETAQKMECVFCHKEFESYASCEDGHYVCDNCHSENGTREIMDFCLNSKSKNPIEILMQIMDNPYIYMHGPEHHIMVGASLLTAYKNSGGDIDLKSALTEMKSRGSKYPGGSCGFWGCCGAAVSSGMFISIITNATPLTAKSWGQANQITAKGLQAIGDIGGPRCCKRNSFTAVLMAVEFVKNEFGIQMELPQIINCTHSARNKQCIKKKCPYHICKNRR